MLQGDLRGSVTKAGPRVLTFPCATDETIQSNCPNCPSSAVVKGEGGGPADLLVHGWYEIQTDVDIYFEQLNPSNACTADPEANGRKIQAGSCFVFFVSSGKRDGVIALIQSSAGTPSTGFNVTKTGCVRVNRNDTTLTMAQTGEDANIKEENVSSICGGELTKNSNC